MNDFEKIFDQDMVSSVNNFIESKIDRLEKVKDFSEKNKRLTMNIENLDEKMPKELKDSFDEMLRLTYQIEEYYFTLAYLLGAKYGEQLEKLL